jgi:hypothetical protein
MRNRAPEGDAVAASKPCFPRGYDSPMPMPLFWLTAIQLDALSLLIAFASKPIKTAFKLRGGILYLW